VDYIVEMRKITKKFPGVIANNRVDFKLKKGSIHGLLGENGAGKTTLMNILYGLCRQTSGDIIVNGARVDINCPARAIDLNIGMVHQHFMLVRPLTVVENIILGLPSPKGPFLDIKAAAQKLLDISNKYKLKVNPHAKIFELSVGEQQRVEILSTLYRGAEILILDEPTAVLTPQETQELFNILRIMKSDGKSIIIITHKLEEIMSITDEVTVLRDGRLIGTKPTGEVDKKILTQMMVGREVLFNFSKSDTCGIDEVLKLDNVCAVNSKGVQVLRNISFCLNKGEILGIAGVDGNGQKELCDAISGNLNITSGEINLDKENLTRLSIKERIVKGIAYVPEDRQKTGLLMNSSIMKNFIIKNFDTPRFSKNGFLKFQAIRSYADKLITEFKVKTTHRNVLVKKLSGGNQQKIVLGREISSEPKVLMVNQPTRGLDIGATEYVRQKLLEQRALGVGILLVSADLEEIFQLADRIAVIYEGEILGIIPGEEATIDQVGLLMAGVRKGVGELDVPEVG